MEDHIFFDWDSGQLIRSETIVLLESGEPFSLQSLLIKQIAFVPKNNLPAVAQQIFIND